jgi:hypothetical protein
MALKICGACDHSERGAIEEALSRGESYREITKQFKVSIGQLKRHRKGHLNGDGSETVGGQKEGEEVFLRFGGLPEGGCSWNFHEECYEEGASVYPGRKVQGGYAFDYPCDPDYRDLTLSIVEMMLAGRALYLAAGAEVGKGGDGEPLLEDILLALASPLARLEVPDWWGPAGRSFADAWNKWRRNIGPKGASSWAECPWGTLEEKATAVLAGVDVALGGSPFKTHAERLEEAREKLRHLRDGRG